MNYKTSLFVIFTAIAGCGRDPSVTARLAWKNTENVRAWQIILIPFNMQDKLIVVGIAKSGTLSPTPVISAAAYQTFFAAICPGTAANRTQNHAVVPTCFSFFLASVIFDVKLYRQIWYKYFKLIFWISILRSYNPWEKTNYKNDLPDPSPYNPSRDNKLAFCLMPFAIWFIFEIDPAIKQ